MPNGNGNNDLAAAQEDYLYDVFLSYSYKSTVKDWVNKKFRQRFEDSLDSELLQLTSPPPPKGRVCLAKRELKPGDPWPQELQEQLRRSKVLVAICSPHYFFSGWCKSEWQSFQNRGTALAIPVLYDGSDAFFAQHLPGIQHADFREFMFIPAARSHLFGQKVIELAESVATRVIGAPSFSGVLSPIVLPAQQTTNARFLSL